MPNQILVVGVFVDLVIEKIGYPRFNVTPWDQEHDAFLVVAGEMVVFQYFFTKALASSPSRAAAAKGVHSKAANEILVVLACVFAAVFGAVWAVFLAEYRSIDAIVRLSLLDMLRALFLVVFYYALVQAAWRLWRRALPRLFLR